MMSREYAFRTTFTMERDLDAGLLERIGDAIDSGLAVGFEDLGHVVGGRVRDPAELSVTFAVSAPGFAEALHRAADVVAALTTVVEQFGATANAFQRELELAA